MSYKIDLFENFKYECPNVKESQIVKHTQISVWEIVVYMSDGSRFIYDDAFKECRHLPPRDSRFDWIDEDEWREEFTIQVRRRMRMKGWTQKKLAEVALIKEVNLSNYLTGKRLPDICTVQRIARALSCDVKYISDFYYLCD